MNTKNALKFLQELSDNNSKEWFESRKPDFQVIKKEFDQFVQRLIDEIAKFDPLISDLEGKKCAYRIYRDVRFSPDKTPYKTHLGASITHGGKNSPYAGYYIHLEPGGKSMIAGGSWMPDGARIKKIREEIDYNADDFKKILNKPSFKNLFNELWDDRLKTAPKGYPKDHPEIELLRYKSFIVHTYIDDTTAANDDAFLQKLVAGAKEIKPLNDFINTAFDLEVK